jgi:hypothetical protein
VAGEAEQATCSREHLRVYQNRTIVLWSTMHDAVPDRAQIDVLLVAQPGARRLKSGRYGRNAGRIITAIHNGLAIRPTCSQVRPRPDPVQLAFDPARQLSSGVNTKHLKLDAG